MNQTAFEAVVKGMATYRPDLAIERIKYLIEDWEANHYEPMAETSQDVIWTYKRELEKLKE